MNVTPEQSADNALRAAMDYADRAKMRASGGAKTELFEDAAERYQAVGMLHGDTPPGQVINKEQPIHVLMCYMQASGHSAEEIAERTGYAVNSVKAVQRQPWYRTRFLSIISKEGGDNVRKFLDGQVMPSLSTLVEIRDSDAHKGPTRVAAANAILDRALGKAVQRTENENHNYDHTKNEEELDREIASLNEELKTRGILGPN